MWVINWLIRCLHNWRGSNSDDSNEQQCENSAEVNAHRNSAACGYPRYKSYAPMRSVESCRRVRGLPSSVHQ